MEHSATDTTRISTSVAIHYYSPKIVAAAVVGSHTRRRAHTLTFSSYSRRDPVPLRVKSKACLGVWRAGLGECTVVLWHIDAGLSCFGNRFPPTLRLCFGCLRNRKKRKKKEESPHKRVAVVGAE